MNMKSLQVGALVALSLLLAACPKKPTIVDTPPAGTTEGGAGATTSGTEGEGGATTRPLPGDGQGGGMAGALPAAPAETVFYFDFDRSDLKPEYAAAIAAHAQLMTRDTTLKVRLEGHTDEQGTREYNIALGERRAQAVRRALMLQGAGDIQITTVSYGEERPAAEGADDESQGRNRRVELSYGR